MPIVGPILRLKLRDMALDLSRKLTGVEAKRRDVIVSMVFKVGQGGVHEVDEQEERASAVPAVARISMKPVTKI